MESLKEFKIEPAPTGAKRVEVNGHDITDSLKAVELLFAAGQVPQIRLHLAAQVASKALEGTGVVVGTPAMEGAVGNFLRSVDRGELEREVMNRQGMGTSPVETMMEVLIEWSEGRSSGAAKP